MKPTLILVNPQAREGALGKEWPELQPEVLEALGEVEVLVEFTSAVDYGAEAVRKALKNGIGRILVVGGDGTISEALQGFYENGKAVAAEAVLAVMPAGRGDDFFKSVIGRRCKNGAEAWTQGLELLKHGKPERVDVGRLAWITEGGSPPSAGTHDRAWLNIASFGFPGLVVKRVMAHAGVWGRSRMGKSRWAYLVQIVTGLAEYKPIPTVVKVDDKVVFDGPLFSGFVLNGYYNAGGIRWSDEARIDDGFFHVVLSEPRGPVAAVLSSPSMLSGDWKNIKGVHRFKGKKVEVLSQQRNERGFPLFEIDGDQPERPATLGAVFECLPGAIRFLK